mmetsp:Transcript_12026/g.22890  ORF Transcript_12026/g.22890 Transcript_12026/m.22890 type:complete len:897 (+) Transcript_12026:111-2801(+)
MVMPPPPLLLLKLVLIIALQTSYTSPRRGPLVVVVTGFANNIPTCKRRQQSSLPQQQQPPTTPHHRTTAIFSTAPPAHRRQEKNTDEIQHDTVSNNLYTCQACHQKFESRNALFRHIRGEGELSSDCPLSMGSRANSTEGMTTTLLTTVVRYGYYLDVDSLDNQRDENEMANEIVANMIHEAFLHRVNTLLGEEEEEEENDGTSKAENTNNFTISTSAVTYSTATNMRQPSLRQDREVIGATSEVMSFNYRLSSNLAATKKWKEYANNNSGQLLLGHMQQALLDVKGSSNNISKNNNNNRMQIQLHQMDALIPRSSKFYSERSCTQTSYRYLLPVKWILPGIIMDDSNNDDDDGDTRRTAATAAAISQVEEWWKQISYYPQSRTSQRDHHHQPGSGGNQRTKSKAPYFITQMKQSLKAAESETEPNRPQTKVNNDYTGGDVNSEDDLADDDEDDNDDATVRLAHGRFGQLWRKHRRCWSNFVHRQLSGMSASPAHEALWRTMDRAIIIGLIDLQNGKDYDCEKKLLLQGSSSSSDEEDDDGKSNYTLRNMHVVLEFRADAFAVSQIPSVVSALVCMTNGWLPARYFDIATRSDVYMPAPPAPPHLGARLHYQSARYHFHELAAEDDTTFEKTIRTGDSREEERWEEGLRSRMLGGLPSDHDEVEMDWLLELRDVVSPDIRRQIESIDEADIHHSLVSSDGVGASLGGLPLVDTDVPSGEYTVTLDLLRRLVESGKWPVTSDARSRVIKSPRSSRTPSETFLTTSKKKAPSSAFPGNITISSGSFTVVNAEIWHDDDDDASLPLANALFPELARSVFELEKEIIRLTSPPLPTAEGMERQSATSSLRRLPSTHCAVNRNAQFTPHVDSGRGLGQSKSMILGLGNYTGVRFTNTYAIY